MLEIYLNSYLAKLEKKGASVADWISDGRALECDFNAFPEVSLPEDLVKFWGVMNGISEPEGTTYEHIWIDGQFVYFSIDQSVNDYRITKELIVKDPKMADYWPIGFVPIGTPGDGSRLLVNCIKDSPTYGAVYELFHGDGVSRLSATLSDYFKMLDELFDCGTISVLESGEVELNFDEYHEKGREMNPRCDGFDDTIQPASMSMDWKKKTFAFGFFKRS
jgi:hypothetical protein